MYSLLSIVIIVGTSIWVHYDAKGIGVQKGQLKGLANLSPAGWLVACLFLWIVSFPLYLLKRGELKRINGKSGSSLGVTLAGVAAIAAVVVGVALGALDAKIESIETTARPLVTSIIQQQLGGNASCIEVSVTDEFKSGFYKAVATLDTGAEIPIMIEDQGAQIIVRIAR